MYPTIVLSLLAIVMMFVCIFKFPSIKIKGITLDTFYLPLVLVAIILLVFRLFDSSNLFNILFSDSTLNPLKILVLFICVSFISIALDEAGFFRYLALIFINKFKKIQKMLFIILYLLISILTIFTSNDIIILTFTPFILYFSKNGKINPIPYLVMEFVAANTYSMMLSIGNPTNIYLASIFNIYFLDYFIMMILPTILCGLVSFASIYFIFRKDLQKEIESFSIDASPIRHKILCGVCLTHLALTTILLAISNYINLQMWIITLCFAISLFIFLTIFSIKKKNIYYLSGSLRRVPYSLIPFILSMFTIIMALDSYDIFKNIAYGIMNIDNDYLRHLVVLISSTISCNLINNIPMTLAFGSILMPLGDISLVFMAIIGSNIGALLTPVGALAGIMWLRMLKQNEVDYSFLKFSKNGIIITSCVILILLCVIFIFL